MARPTSTGTRRPLPRPPSRTAPQCAEQTRPVGRPRLSLFTVYFFPIQALEELLIALGSAVPAESVAVLHTLPTADFHGTSILTVSDAPAARPTHWQLTDDSATVHFAFGDAVTVAGGGPMNRLELASNATF